MADSSTTTRPKKKKSSHKSKKKSETASKELSPPDAASKELSPAPPSLETQDEPKTDSPTRATSSPDPNCAICLSRLENKSFTDSCFHMFCFVCLLEWSKVKNECPLCKQSFKSIIHNVRSYDDYEQYHLSLYRGHSPEHPYSRRFRYRTTLTEDRVFNLRNRLIGNPATDPETVLQLQAIGAPPNAFRATDYSTRHNWNRRRQASTSDFRKRIYNDSMRLVSVHGTNGRVRDTSPAFYRANPALTHRLVPWLNRELNALLFNQESNVQFVLELIMDLIKRFEINSEEFFQRLSPFLMRHTRQFMQEFESFAKSPYCMIVYDQKARYEHVAQSVSSDTDSVNAISDDDSDIQIVSTEAAPIRPTTELLNLPDISAEMQVRTSNPFYPFGGSSFLSSSSWNSPTPGPSWFPEPTVSLPPRDFIPALGRSVGLSDTEIDSSSDSKSSAGSDIMVVAYDKPWDERSPIKLSTDSEAEVIQVNESKESKKQKSKSKSDLDSNANIGANVEISNLVDIEDTTPAPSVPSVVERPDELPSTSQENSHRSRSRHKSKSWRNNHYNNRLKILFHRRSTSPEMSDSGRRKEPGTDLYELSATSSFRPSRQKRKHKHKHKHRKSSRGHTDGSVQGLLSTSTSRSRSPDSRRRHRKKSRKESRSPSVEIISVHHKDKSRKKHKKHKHKSSRKAVKSSIILPSHPDPESDKFVETDGPNTTDPSSQQSSTRTSEACESSRSLTGAPYGICDTLTPVEIASSIAKKSDFKSSLKEQDNVLDLTAGNTDELDNINVDRDELYNIIMDVVTNDASRPTNPTDLSLEANSLDPDSSKSFKKHPCGHKRSRATDNLGRSDAIPNSSTLPAVMMHGDPLFSHVPGASMYSNELESFHSAFASNYNPHAWYKHPPVYTNPISVSGPLNLGLWPSSTASSVIDHISVSKPVKLGHQPSSTTSTVTDPLPLDLRQIQQADSTKPTTMELAVSSSGKSSTVTSSNSFGESDSQILSPVLDVVSLDDGPQVISVENDASPSGSAIIDVTDISPTEIQSSDSEETVCYSPDLNMFSNSPTPVTDGENLPQYSAERETREDTRHFLKEDVIPDTEGTRFDNIESDLDVENCDETPLEINESQGGNCQVKSSNNNQISEAMVTDSVTSSDKNSFREAFNETVVNDDVSASVNDVSSNESVIPNNSSSFLINHNDANIGSNSSSKEMKYNYMSSNEHCLEHATCSSDVVSTGKPKSFCENNMHVLNENDNVINDSTLQECDSNSMRLPCTSSSSESIAGTSEFQSTDGNSSMVNFCSNTNSGDVSVIHSETNTKSVPESSSEKLNNNSLCQFPLFWSKKVTPLVNSTWREEGSSEESNNIESSSSDSEIEVDKM